MDDLCAKPEHCIRGEVDRWTDEWVDEDGAQHIEEGCYYECHEWEPGWPPIMTERAHVYRR